MTIFQSRSRLSRASGSMGGDYVSRSCSNYRPGSINAGRTILTAILILPLMWLTACNNATLANIAKAELAVSTACSGAFQTVTQAAASNPPLISQADANNIVGILLKIEQANAQAETATAAINTLNSSNQASLLNIIQPIQAAIAGAINTGAVNISDPATKTAVLASLTAVQVAVTAVATLIRQAKTSS